MEFVILKREFVVGVMRFYIMKKIIYMALYPFLWGYLLIKCHNLWTIKNYLRVRRNSFLQNFFISCYENKMQDKYSAWISYHAIFLDQPCFPHGYNGIFISEGATIGKNCVIFQQVTIGSNTLKGSKKFGSPFIGNNVYIGAGAKIIGNIEIGDNCRIGANAVVVEDMPKNSIAVQSPTRIILKEDVLDNRYFSNRGDHYCYYENGEWRKE